MRVGMEATGYSRWFERLLAELGFEVWMGDPAEIKAKRVKKRKYDREDARLIRRLMLENNFPQIWVPSPENRDLRQLLWHRHRLVQMRTRIMNQLQALAMNEGYRWKKKLFSEQGRALLEKLSLAPWASRRRQELLELLPCEESSARKQRLGHISKQGSSLLRFLLVEAAQAAARIHPDWRCRYKHLAMRRHKSIAKVAMGRRMAIKLYWMWRNGCEYSQSVKCGSYAGQLGTVHGVK